MAIVQTKKQSDLEKRLKLLRQQVYGKVHEKTNPMPRAAGITTDDVRQYPTYNLASIKSDITYLHQDLLKILTLSSLAIGTQVILFFLSKNHIVNLNFF